MAESKIATISIKNVKGLDLFTNPIAEGGASLIRAVNVESYPNGAKSKRPGYVTMLGVGNGSAVQDLFSWTKNDGSLFLYKKAGDLLYHSVQGTAAWTIAGNGTVTPANHMGQAVLGNTLVVCDGAGSTRHTTNGTSFTNTTLAPVAVSLAMYQNRIYAAGTASDTFYSTANDATNWSTSGTSDSSSIAIPGAGKMRSVFTVADRLIATKTSQLMYKWDGFSLIDMASNLGPSSPNSIATSEGFKFWMNDLGLFGYGGERPKVMSNVVQPIIYNNMGSAVTGAQFADLPAECHKYSYYATLGTVTDDVHRYTINDAVLKYDYQKDEFLTWNLANRPTAYHSYIDTSGDRQLIFGGSNGQVYKLAGTATTDNGTAIETVMEFVIDGTNPQDDKKWIWLTAFFNPGCQAAVSIAYGDTYMKDAKKWQEIGDSSSGVLEWRFPQGSRSKLLFVRIYESSKDPGFAFYGMTVQAEVIVK